MCSRCFCSSLWICQSVQSLVVLFARLSCIHGPLGSRSLALWGVLRDRVGNQLSSRLSTNGSLLSEDRNQAHRVMPRECAVEFIRKKTKSKRAYRQFLIAFVERFSTETSPSPSATNWLNLHLIGGTGHGMSQRNLASHNSSISEPIRTTVCSLRFPTTRCIASGYRLVLVHSSRCLPSTPRKARTGCNGTLQFALGNARPPHP
jgi:hypothetical protein